MVINIPYWTTSKEEADKLVDELSEVCFEYGKNENNEKLLDVFYATKALKNYVGIMQGRIDSGGAGMNTLKPCPFCGGAKICTEKSINRNYCDNCSAESNVEQWNTRPIEDALSKRIAELEDKDDIETEQKMTDKLIFTGKTILDMSKISYTLTADGYLVIFTEDSTIEIPIETEA